VAQFSGFEILERFFFGQFLKDVAFELRIDDDCDLSDLHLEFWFCLWVQRKSAATILPRRSFKIQQLSIESSNFGDFYYYYYFLNFQNSGDQKSPGRRSFMKIVVVVVAEGALKL
jgi:hypothetical protein